MKRCLIGGASIAALVAAMSVAACAQNTPFQITEAPKMTPTIDGDPVDWESIEGFDMSFAHGERSGAANSDPLEVNIKYAWDDDNFYTMITEISDDDPSEGFGDVDWCNECTGAAGIAAPWSTDSIGFYDKGIKWPGLSDDPSEANILEVGPYHQYWVGLTLEEDMEINGEPQYRHLARTTNDSRNENGTSRIVGPNSEENEASLPLVPDLEELTEPQSAFRVLPGEENDGRGRRTVEFFMSWDQLRYSGADPRDEVQDRIDELLPGIEGHLREDVKEGYEFRLEPLLVDGIEDNTTFGSQTHPSGVEHPDINHTFEWEHISVVRLTGASDPKAALDEITDPEARLDYVHNVLGTWMGDSNCDGEFNSGDLVSVFGSGEYEDGVVGNSTWATGDWNGDSEFDSSDLVTAFTDGGYEIGPRPAAAAVPEPAAYCLLVMGTLSVALMRRR